MTKTFQHGDRLLMMRQVREIVPYSRTHIYRLINAGTLVVITQRPSEVSRTVLSQCNNFIAMRLTNAEDQSVIKKLLPDSLGGFGDVLPILDTGEALVVGDATILPIRVRVNEPEQKPDSGTIPFWNEWSKTNVTEYIQDAVDSWRLQSLKN